ncbi:MAG: shikimate dehydrogenase [Armatimonadetes bacterium]|nr:shikimate dehydrogenase [Armatimonadota bacterium]
MDWYEWSETPEGEFAVIGDPVSHSLSPRMHSEAYAALGLSYRYRAVRVPVSEFEEAVDRLRSLGYWGLNVTVPLKETAYRSFPGGDPRQGAVNTINLRDDRATNTDAPGFMGTLRDLGVAPCKSLVLGAGGSARALVVALADAGFEVLLFNRTSARATALCEQVQVPVTVLENPDPAGCALIVNGTSAGLRKECPPVLWGRAEPGAVAYDLTYSGEETPFVRAAGEVGLRAVDGRRMLVDQGALSFEWWTGLPAPREAMLHAVL